MHKRDTFDVLCSVTAVAADALAVFAGFALAIWIRFSSGWIPLVFAPPASFAYYHWGNAVATLLMLFIFKELRLYERPQTGPFSEKIPRVIRACGMGILLAMVLAFIVRVDPPYSRIVVLLASVTVTSLVLLQRFAMARIERHYAKHLASKNRIVILGVTPTAAQLKRALEREPRLRSQIAAFLTVNETEVAPGIPPALIRGSIDDLESLLEQEKIDQIILTESGLSHKRMVDLMLLCERHVAAFNLVPDVFGLLAVKLDIQTIEGIPLLGSGKWPLDYYWNRAIKRLEDIAGAVAGLLIGAPFVAVAALCIRRDSPGPVLFRQERCGEGGKPFTLYKLRTMRMDAEEETGPVWTTENDPRCTRVGAMLRRWNIDELPQFWNVLRGDMSLVGPRPERPHFVEQFRSDINRYMWRHVSKPGMTGWAQVNGLRGNTSIQDRITYDLYYLENWSVALDFKVICKTFICRANAY